jgi:S1-C subfamily serine protease
LELPQKPKTMHITTIILITIVIASLFAGGLIGYLLGYSYNPAEVDNLQKQVTELQQQVSNLQSTQNLTYQNNTYLLDGNVSLSQLYDRVKDAVVTVRGVLVQYDIFRRPYYSQVQGSGFVYNFTGEMVIVTNYHVVQNAINITITFADGDGYAAEVLGSDPYADLAVLSTSALQSELVHLEIASSSSLEVGDQVIAVGNPYGLAGSMTTGIVSALGRTITEEMTGSYPIANIIQTSAPINPGNSGGPLLNLQGQVVGITTAIISDSQGLSFAIPSNTIQREINSLVISGSYDQHPWLGASGIDMTYEIAKAMNVNVTYGWLLTQITSGGPADEANLHGGTKQVQIAGELTVIGGDIITAINGARITNTDALSTYLEEYAAPNQTISVTIVRNSEIITLSVTLGARPAPT